MIRSKKRDEAPKIERNTPVFPFPIKNVLCPSANISKVQWSLGIHGGLVPWLLRHQNSQRSSHSCRINTTIHSACHIRCWTSSDSTSCRSDWLNQQTQNLWIWRANSTNDQYKLQERQSGESYESKKEHFMGTIWNNMLYPPTLRLVLKINKHVYPYNQQKKIDLEKSAVKVQSDSQNIQFSEYMKGYLHC